MKVNITKYWERLWAEDLFAAIILEEDFDLDENGAPRANCTNWAAEFRAELNGYIAAPKCCEERREDYRKALAILDEMEQNAAEQSNATAAPDYTALADTIRAELNARHDRSAWDKAVTLYALGLLDDVQEGADNMKRLPLDGAELERWALNGASCWEQYSNGGCSLCYNVDIAARVCTPSELKRTDCGMNAPNSRETWLDVQARALYQACNRIRTICRANGLYYKEV
nr:MAG TPA: hypothetical protein [Caudoviricetes sp.]